MKRLLDNVTSQYVEAANRLLPKRNRRRIVAFVESYDDVAFWRLLLDEFENGSRYFQIMLPSADPQEKEIALRSYNILAWANI